jgi:NAD(P)-dependent dehydrogenase (short-subunit alcohol dehydrogenase family)
VSLSIPSPRPCITPPIAARSFRGVRPNAVAPGPVRTPLLQATLDDPVLGPLADALPVPLGRRAAPGEIAHAVTFLLAPASAYIHGAVLFVGGGTDALLRPDVI